MLIKAGVDISKLNREVRRTLTPVEAWLHGLECELVIMSTYEGNHIASSLHYGNDAYSFRRDKKVTVAEGVRLQKLLGNEFCVVFSWDKGEIEYDPKGEPGGDRDYVEGGEYSITGGK